MRRGLEFNRGRYRRLLFRFYFAQIFVSVLNLAFVWYAIGLITPGTKERLIGLAVLAVAFFYWRMLRLVLLSFFPASLGRKEKANEKILPRLWAEECARYGILDGGVYVHESEKELVSVDDVGILQKKARLRIWKEFYVRFPAAMFSVLVQHELGHVRSSHCVIRFIVHTCSFPCTQLLLGIAKLRSKVEGINLSSAAIILLYFERLLHYGSYAFIAQCSEYVADALAVEALGSPTSLIVTLYASHLFVGVDPLLELPREAHLLPHPHYNLRAESVLDLYGMETPQ